MKTKLYALYIYDFELSQMVRVSKWQSKEATIAIYNEYSQVKREIRELGS